MIVKNESRVIRRLLESVAEVVDSYCICDTGSTDNTVELIQTFFQERNVPGVVNVEPFRDFGHNRSVALKMCEEVASPADYVLLLDADMVFQLGADVSPSTFKQGLTKDVYYIYQGSESFYHKNVRIVKNRIGASYWGVTHEYLKSPPGAVYAQIPKSTAFINDIGDGGSKSDKFVRDIRLLKKGLEDVPNNDRYTFYLANSYRDNGDLALAIETYKKRVELGGWHEEIWYSYYNIGKCYRALGDMVQAIHWWLEGYQFYPRRIENLYEIIQYYRINGKSELAYLYFNMAIKQLVLHPNGDYLFMGRDIYDYKLNYEFSVFGYYCNVDKYDLTLICTKVWNSKLVEDSLAKNVLSNYKFYAKKLIDCVEDHETQLRVQLALRDFGKARVQRLTGSEDAFVSSTPSLAKIYHGGRAEAMVAVNVRYVNYRINDSGGYENREHISTVNVLGEFSLETWKKTREGILWYDREHDGLYEGLEDVRLFSHSAGFHVAYDPTLWYNANRGLSHHKLVVEHGEAEYAECTWFGDHGRAVASENGGGGGGKHGFVFKQGGQREVEKNWVLCEEDVTGKTKIIYQWHPLIVGDVVTESDLPDSDDEGVELAKQATSSSESSGTTFFLRSDSDRSDSDQSDSDLDRSDSDLDQIHSSSTEAENRKRPQEDWLMVPTHTIDTPGIFKYFRGSTNGVLMKGTQSSGGRNELWFICHAVSYEDRRYYYHAFVALDAQTFEVRRYTPLFTFEGEKVEYTLGFVVHEANLYVGYSTMDRTTKYMVVPRKSVESMMISA
jgi:tetratricopeptide (TPR) repeat protein